MEATMQGRQQNVDFTILAKQIDSTLDPDLSAKLKSLEYLNLFCKVGMFGNEELIPVGSCIDGSKINLPNDAGDIDILIVPNRVLLKEYLFDYDKMHPAFLHIRINDEHEKHFITIKNPIDGVYLPAVVLKEVHERFFFLSRIFLKSETRQGISRDRNYLNVTRPSAVGKEQMKLNGDTLDAFGIEEEKVTLKFKMARMGKFASKALRSMKDMVDDPDETDEFENRNQNSNSNENTSLLELLHTFLDGNQTKQVNENTDQRNVCLDEDNQTVSSRESNASVANYSGTETELIGITQDRSCSGHIAETCTSSQSNAALESTNLAELRSGNTKEKNIVSDPANSNKTKPYSSTSNGTTISMAGKSARCQHELHVKRKTNEVCTHRPEKFTRYEDSKFSKLKSTDFVPAYKFEGWPRTAEEWLMRERKWPSKVIVKKVLETGCQVVAKRPRSSYHNTEFHATAKTDERDPYFRLSFSLSEIILAQSMKEQQLLCWRVLKAYQKCFLKTNTKFLTSYHWKNVVFWVSEDLEESFWTDENVLTAVVKCLDYMIVCLRDSILPLYFVSRMNLFHGFEKLQFDNMIVRLEDIRKKPLEYLQRFIDNPPDPETYLLNVNEIQSMLSKKEKAKHIDEVSDELVHGFVRLFPSLCKTSEQEDFQIRCKDIISKFRSTITAQSPGLTNEAQRKDSLPETILIEIENMFASFNDENGSNEEKTFGDAFRSLSHVISRTDESEKPFERKIKQTFSDVFGELASTFSTTSEDDTYDENTLLTSFHKLATTMHEEIISPEQRTCTETNDEETKEGETLKAAISGAFPKFIEAVQKTVSKEDKDFSITDELKRILESVSQELEISNKNEKQRSKTAMDIELD